MHRRSEKDREREWARAGERRRNSNEQYRELELVRSGTMPGSRGKEGYRRKRNTRTTDSEHYRTFHVNFPLCAEACK